MSETVRGLEASRAQVEEPIVIQKQQASNVSYGEQRAIRQLLVREEPPRLGREVVVAPLQTSPAEPRRTSFRNAAISTGPPASRRVRLRPGPVVDDLNRFDDRVVRERQKSLRRIQRLSQTDCDSDEDLTEA